MITALVLTLVTAAMNDTAKPNDDVVYRKHTVVDFASDVIESGIAKPETMILDGHVRQRGPRLIRMREQFRSEILSSFR